MRPLQPLVEIFRQLGGAGRALPSPHKTHPASTFGGPRLVRRPLGIIHVTDVYVVFGLRRYKFWLSRAPGYLGTRDEKSGLMPIPQSRPPGPSPAAYGSLFQFWIIFPTSTEPNSKSCWSWAAIRPGAAEGHRSLSHTPSLRSRKTPVSAPAPSARPFPASRNTT